VPALAQGARAGHPVTPPDGPGRERVEQRAAQLAAQHLGAPTRTVVGLLEQDGPAPVEEPHRLTARQDEGAELVHQSRRLQCRLAGVVMDVEHPALRPRGGGGLRLVDRGRDAVDMEDTGQGQPAEAGADDRDVSGHDDSLLP